MILLQLKDFTEATGITKEQTKSVGGWNNLLLSLKERKQNERKGVRLSKTNKKIRIFKPINCEGCGRKIKHYAKGLCNNCYHKEYYPQKRIKE